VADLLAANPDLPGESALQPNDLIALPIPAVVPRLHALRPGDSLRSLSRAYGVPLGRLLARNPELCDPRALQPGWVVAIPGLRGDSAPTSALSGGSGGGGAGGGSSGGGGGAALAQLQLAQLQLLGGGGGYAFGDGPARRHSDSARTNVPRVALPSRAAHHHSHHGHHRNPQQHQQHQHHHHYQLPMAPLAWAQAPEGSVLAGGIPGGAVPSGAARSRTGASVVEPRWGRHSDPSFLPLAL
jgi:hypothetical protein